MISDSRTSRGLKLLPAAAALFLVGSTVFTTACSDEERSYVANAGPATPTMSTLQVNTFISDSGYTRYFITAPRWDMYDDAEDPYWFFPEGLELEQYDLDFRPSANMRCDSAKYLSDKRVWRLDGNVVMVNNLRDSFLTQQVYWDQFRREVYSDSFIHIVRSDRVIEGYGFTSNEQMSRYTVNRPTGIFPTERRQSSDSASAQSDSMPTLRERHGAPIRSSERQEDYPRFVSETERRQTPPPPPGRQSTRPHSPRINSRTR